MPWHGRIRPIRTMQCWLGRKPSPKGGQAAPRETATFVTLSRVTQSRVSQFFRDFRSIETAQAYVHAMRVNERHDDLVVGRPRKLGSEITIGQDKDKRLAMLS